MIGLMLGPLKVILTCEKIGPKSEIRQFSKRLTKVLSTIKWQSTVLVFLWNSFMYLFSLEENQTAE